ncbi:MAG: Clp protease, partial [Spirochaetales bacterium]
AFGFSGNGGVLEHRDIKSSAVMELKRLFRPEFLNRVDEIVVFHSLDREHIAQIMELMLQEVSRNLQEFSITLSVRDSARELLLDKGFDMLSGARSLRRAIQKHLEDPLSVAILQGRFQEGDSVAAEARNNKISFRRKNKRKKKADTDKVTISQSGE